MRIASSKSRALLIFCLAFGAGSLLLYSYLGKPERKRTVQAQQALALSRQWLLNFQKESGLFNYHYWVHKNSFADDDNIVRQVGAFYSLIELFRYSPDPELREGIRRFRQAVLPLVRQDTIQGRPIAYVEFEGLSKINTNALYLLSLTELVRAGLPLLPLEEEIMPQLANGLLLMENKESGGFWYLYYVPRERNKVTPYGTGEALYALIRYYRYIKQDPEIPEVCTRSFEPYFGLAMQEEFDGDNLRALFAWALYYLAECEDLGIPGNYPYMEQFLEKALSYQAANPDCREIGCIRVRAIGEASFLEGITRVYPYVKERDAALARRLKEGYIDKMVDFFCALQMSSEEDFQALAGRPYEGELRYLVGGFCNRPECTSFRNDFNQHATISLLNTLNYVY